MLMTWLLGVVILCIFHIETPFVNGKYVHGYCKTSEDYEGGDDWDYYCWSAWGCEEFYNNWPFTYLQSDDIDYDNSILINSSLLVSKRLRDEISNHL